MVSAPPKILTNTWVAASWEEFIAISDGSEHQAHLEKAQFYYSDGLMKIEDVPHGFSHGRTQSLIATAVSLYGTLQNLDFISLNRSSFRKRGKCEGQPDLAFYFGRGLPKFSPDNNPVNVELYGPPTLVIEIAVDALISEAGRKRMLYERLDVDEYWIVDVTDASIIALSVAKGGSRQIKTSAVLPDLQIAVIEEGLQRSQAENDGAVNRWLLKQFSGSNSRLW